MVRRGKGIVKPENKLSVPHCDRCHNLIHHHSGVPIRHPSIQSIEETISSSPHKVNHIYHILDAADFPMSLIPNISRYLNVPRLRTQNRRSKSHRYVNGRIADVSFIITRSDLLAPKKEQVDSLMPYLTDVLRDALGRHGKNVRLGNVRCVSAKRGWWTKDVKESIWNRGGGGWLVGKVNVGKSRLFEEVFPKGRNEEVNFDRLRHKAGRDVGGPKDAFEESEELGSETSSGRDAGHETDAFDESAADPSSLLPPPQPETAYPSMPIVSSLPGTTASPIRVPFGNGRGELIDLPGLARNDLEKYVRGEQKQSLIMQSRCSPEQQTVKPGQSLLLDGLVRITPTTPDLVFLTHAFVPLKTHVTSTEKATNMPSGDRTTDVPLVAEDSARPKMASAGKFQLRWDVTKRHVGPLTRRDAVGLKAESLPFRVYAADVLIEGCGWVEVVAQVRRFRRVGEGSASDGNGRGEGVSVGERAEQFPEVEVFSPEGRSIGIRKPLGASVMGGKAALRKGRTKGARPRQSMKSVMARRVPKQRG